MKALLVKVKEFYLWYFWQWGSETYSVKCSIWGSFEHKTFASSLLNERVSFQVFSSSPDYSWRGSRRPKKPKQLQRGKLSKRYPYLQFSFLCGTAKEGMRECLLFLFSDSLLSLLRASFRIWACNPYP